jgi:hypothetical protein
MRRSTVLSLPLQLVFPPFLSLLCLGDCLNAAYKDYLCSRQGILTKGKGH